MTVRFKKRKAAIVLGELSGRLSHQGDGIMAVCSVRPLSVATDDLVGKVRAKSSVVLKIVVEHSTVVVTCALFRVMRRYRCTHRATFIPLILGLCSSQHPTASLPRQPRSSRLTFSSFFRFPISRRPLPICTLSCASFNNRVTTEMQA